MTSMSILLASRVASFTIRFRTLLCSSFQLDAYLVLLIVQVANPSVLKIRS
uniref:Uncharacterized protein n=1 Tax=Arundo donax TaxID=35708 RepID=A0A0A9A6P7_ARUDO